MGHALVVPDAKFSCHSCAHCCTDWDVPVSAARVARLREHAWGDEPFVALRGAADDSFRIRRGADGRCFFLDDRNRCRIHSTLGEHEKPEACRAFPLRTSVIGGRTFVRLSHFCPSVAAGHGKPLREQLGWIRDVIRHSGSEASGSHLALLPDGEATSAEVELVDAALAEELHRGGGAQLDDRLRAASAILLRVVQARERGETVGETLAHAHTDGSAALAREARDRARASEAGLVLDLFLAQDSGSGTLARLRGLIGALLFSGRLGKFHSRSTGAAASWRALTHVTYLSPAADARTTEWLLEKLATRRHLSGGLSVSRGWNLLVTAYGIANLVGRIRAAQSGRIACDDDDALAALAAADLLVLEHSSLLANPRFARVIESLLRPPTFAVSVLEWLPRRPPVLAGAAPMPVRGLGARV